jgi:glycosyltransferase involved in cell wall biosynthesis
VAVDEFVSCVMATRNRRHFFRQAVRCFLRQTYKHSELIVVDDGERPVAELCPRSARVRYVRLPRLTPTGTKLNIGIKEARGTVIQNLDDDDYYHPDFLKLAVSRLPDKNRTRCLVGWDCFLVLLAGEARVCFSGHGWVAGGTFCFSRELWERTNFRDVPRDYDDWFLRDLQPEVVPVCAPEHYILVRHGRNTWKRMRNRQRVDDFFRGLPKYKKPLADLVDPRAQAFYRSLARGKCPE